MLRTSDPGQTDEKTDTFVESGQQTKYTALYKYCV